MVNIMKLSNVQTLFACCIFTLQVKFQYAAEVEINAMGKMKMAKKSPKDPKPKPGLSDGFQNGKDKPEVGLCLSAGTFAASIVGGGIMRGFQKSKLKNKDDEEEPALSRFDYIVGASGGLNPIFIYGYAQNTTSDEILDADGISDPSLLTEEILNNIPEKSLFAPFSQEIAPLFLYGITERVLNQKVPYVAVVEKMVLEPFGILPDHPIDQTRDGVHAELITTASIVGPLDIYSEWRININKKFLNLLQEGDRFEDFGPIYKLLPSNDEIWEIIKDSNFKVPIPVFMTSKEFTLPTAAFKVLLDHPTDNLEFEPMSLPLDQVQHEGDGPFTVSKMLGMGTNIITMIIYKNAIPEFAQNLLDTPILLDIPDKNGNKQEMVVSDGGFNDWEGMLSLLKKNVTKIVCGIYKTADRVNTSVEPWLFATYFIQDYFGVIQSGSYEDAYNTSQFDEERLVYPNTLHLEHTRRVFNIFSNGENQFQKLADMYKSLYLAGEPMIATLENLEVVENKLWGIEGGMRVDVTFVSTIGVPKKFSEQIPEDLIPPAEGMNFVTETGYFTNDDFKYFPGFNLGNQLTLDIDVLDLSLPLGMPDFQVPTKFARLLEILTSWMVERAWDGLRGDDGEVKFGGFKNILS